MSFGSGFAKIIGKGTMSLVNGKRKEQNAWYVEGLKHNLLSVKQICDQGHDLMFSSKECEIRRWSSRKLVGRGVRTTYNVYILSEIQEERCYMSQVY